jgi:general secretion pathway protein I
MTAKGQRGFTLMETMLALAILAGGLALSIATTAANVRQAHRAQVLGVATNLARGKMYDIEEELVHEGFQELEQTMDGDFSDEDWPDIIWEAKVEKIELPGLASLQAADSASEDGDALDGASGTSEDSTGAGMLGAGIVGSQFEMISSVLEMSIRRVTLKVTWTVGQATEDMTIVAYITNEQGIAQAMAGAPADSGGQDDGPQTQRGTSSGRRSGGAGLKR